MHVENFIQVEFDTMHRKLVYQKKKKKENHLHVIFYAKRKGMEKNKKHLSSGSGTRSFNIALNTTLAYIYNYTSGI